MSSVEVLEFIVEAKQESRSVAFAHLSTMDSNCGNPSVDSDALMTRLLSLFLQRKCH